VGPDIVLPQARVPDRASEKWKPHALRNDSNAIMPDSLVHEGIELVAFLCVSCDRTCDHRGAELSASGHACMSGMISVLFKKIFLY
jgi:hypothetical protein